MAEDSAKINDQLVISFELDSDTMQEEVEYIHFEAKEWDDENMNVDL